MQALAPHLAFPWRYRALLWTLTHREIVARYRGSVLGTLWSLLTPLLMLAVFTLVFGIVLPSRWPGAAGEGIGMFALALLSGLLLHTLLADVLSKAPGLIVTQPNYVTKMVFPLEALGWISLLAALFHAGCGLLLLVLVNGVWGSGFALPQLALPVILLLFSVMVLGLAWLFAALGVYVRDLVQLVGPLIMVLMFMGPVFFPRSAMPEPMRPWLALNPITIPIEQARRVIFDGHWPDWASLGWYALAACAMYLFGLWVFNTLKKGFADVL